MTNFTGSKYQDGQDVAVIAKGIRADIKAAVAAGELPRGKYAVTISRYSMGRSITVTIADVPVLIHNVDRVRGTDQDAAGKMIPWMSEPARALVGMVEAIVKAYQRDRSDITTDYFNVNFYDHVNFETTFSNRQHDAIKAIPAGVRITARPLPVVAQTKPALRLVVSR